MDSTSPDKPAASSDKTAQGTEGAQAKLTAQSMMTEINAFRWSGSSHDFNNIVNTWNTASKMDSNIPGEPYASMVAKDLVNLIDQSHDPLLPTASFDGVSLSFKPSIIDSIASALPSAYLIEAVAAKGQLQTLYGGGEGHGEDMVNKISFGPLQGGGGDEVVGPLASADSDIG